MLNLYELKLLVAFSEYKTLTRVAEELHISTPSVTRSMQSLEESFGVPIFNRGKNKIELNETGVKAVEYAEKILYEADNAVKQVRAFDMSSRTITIKSCAPMPLWKLLPSINELCSENTVASNICQNEEVIEALKNDVCDIGILPFIPSEKGYMTIEYMREELFVCVSSTHELAKNKLLSFEDINGFNFLLRSELGFWDTLCRSKMPASRFLVQRDSFEFDELVKSSSLPCFSTDAALRDNFLYYDRINIPLADEEARVTFYIVIKNDSKYRNIISALAKRTFL